MKAPVKKERNLNPAIPLLWLGFAIWGTVAMMSSSSQPSLAASPPVSWPIASKLPRPSGKPVLIMFVHPHCACSRASMAQLAQILNLFHDNLDAYALVLNPARHTANGIQSAIWQQASEVHGLRVLPDDSGHEARLFRAETSGEVVLYGADGRLRFQGGLTLGRGIMGENSGCAAVRAILSHQSPWLAHAPVYGCRLFEAELASKK